MQNLIRFLSDVMWCREEGVQAGMRTVQEWKDQIQAWVHHIPSPFVVSSPGQSTILQNKFC